MRVCEPVFLPKIFLQTRPSLTWWVTLSVYTSTCVTLQGVKSVNSLRQLKVRAWQRVTYVYLKHTLGSERNGRLENTVRHDSPDINTFVVTQVSLACGDRNNMHARTAVSRGFATMPFSCFNHICKMVCTRDQMF